jgi:MSHA biogenesis protein MshJ
MVNKLRENFERLSLREKVIVIVVLLVALGSGWDNFFYEAIAQRQNILQQQQITFSSEKAVQEAVMKLKKPVSADPNLDNQKKLAELKIESAQQQEQIELSNHQSFVSAASMAEALSDVLNKNKQLTLINLDTLPTTPLLEVKQQGQVIYKHELVITFSGKYIDTVNYLKALEALPWAIDLDSIDYKVKAYPLAEITIHIVTLSLDEDFLGV